MKLLIYANSSNEEIYFYAARIRQPNGELWVREIATNRGGTTRILDGYWTLYRAEDIEEEYLYTPAEIGIKQNLKLSTRRYRIDSLYVPIIDSYVYLLNVLNTFREEPLEGTLSINKEKLYGNPQYQAIENANFVGSILFRPKGSKGPVPIDHIVKGLTNSQFKYLRFEPDEYIT